jgi:hypothetical protein
MTRRNLAALIVIAVIAALLAFPFREAAYHLLVIPLAYLFWLLGLFYRSINQSIWWIGIALVTLLVLGTSLLPEIKPNGKRSTSSARNAEGWKASRAHWRNRIKGRTSSGWWQTASASWRINFSLCANTASRARCLPRSPAKAGTRPRMCDNISNAGCRGRSQTSQLRAGVICRALKKQRSIWM